jgi:F420-non-reducing hydrogenase large subunit
MGRPTDPVFGLPGGVSKGFSKELADFTLKFSKEMIEFAKFSLKAFYDIVLGNEDYKNIILSDGYKITTHYMGLVDENNYVNVYDGKVRVVSSKGKELAKFPINKYLDYIGENVEEWSYIKFPYLKSIGWKGLKDGEDNGIYRVAPLARLNAADGMATPLANAEYKKMYEILGQKPVHNTLAYHWARLIEVLYTAEHVNELIQDKETLSDNIRVIPKNKPTEGIGVVEAPRGTLIHHYKTDEKGILEKVNLIVATVHNSPAICLSIKKAAQSLIKNNVVNDGLLNQVEMAFRAYDPCLACATHTASGEMPLIVEVFNKKKELIKKLVQD